MPYVDDNPLLTEAERAAAKREHAERLQRALEWRGWRHGATDRAQTEQVWRMEAYYS